MAPLSSMHAAIQICFLGGFIEFCNTSHHKMNITITRFVTVRGASASAVFSPNRKPLVHRHLSLQAI